MNDCEHLNLEPMHHYGPEGKDYGPTGYLMCPDCYEIFWDESESTT